MGIMEKKMETTIMYYTGFRALGETWLFRQEKNYNISHVKKLWDFHHQVSTKVAEARKQTENTQPDNNTI